MSISACQPRSDSGTAAKQRLPLRGDFLTGGDEGVESEVLTTNFTNGHESSAVTITDATGTTEGRYRYTAFGGAANTVTNTTFAATQPYRFSTKYLDKEVETAEGTYYYGYRHYVPVIGRWPSRDPIGERGGQNLYGMTRNRPTLLVDVLGQWEYESECSEKAHIGNTRGWISNSGLTFANAAAPGYLGASASELVHAVEVADDILDLVELGGAPSQAWAKGAKLAERVSEAVQEYVGQKIDDARKEEGVDLAKRLINDVIIPGLKAAQGIRMDVEITWEKCSCEDGTYFWKRMPKTEYPCFFMNNGEVRDNQSLDTSEFQDTTVTPKMVQECITKSEQFIKNLK
jgi:RHS repeat-associated protein